MTFWILLPCLLFTACDTSSNTPEESSTHFNQIGRLHILQDGTTEPLSTFSETDINMEISSPNDTPHNITVPAAMKPLELKLK